MTYKRVSQAKKYGQKHRRSDNEESERAGSSKNTGGNDSY
jgi:hypothetical protein